MTISAFFSNNPPGMDDGGDGGGLGRRGVDRRPSI